MNSSLQSQMVESRISQKEIEFTQLEEQATLQVKKDTNLILFIKIILNNIGYAFGINTSTGKLLNFNNDQNLNNGVNLELSYNFQGDIQVIGFFDPKDRKGMHTGELFVYEYTR